MHRMQTVLPWFKSNLVLLASPLRWQALRCDDCGSVNKWPNDRGNLWELDDVTVPQKIANQQTFQIGVTILVRLAGRNDRACNQATVAGPGK